MDDNEPHDCIVFRERELLMRDPAKCLVFFLKFLENVQLYSVSSTIIGFHDLKNICLDIKFVSMQRIEAEIG